MRALLLIISLFLILPATHAHAAALPAATHDKLPPASGLPDSVHHKFLYEKGKGTVGFLCGLVLGPVGYFSVKALSHNYTQHRRAKKGLIIWASVVFFAGIIVLSAAAAKHGAGGPINIDPPTWPDSKNVGPTELSLRKRYYPPHPGPQRAPITPTATPITRAAIPIAPTAIPIVAAPIP